MISLKRERMKRQLKEAQDYEGWKSIAIKMDKINGLEAWKRNDVSNDFDHEEIRRRLDKLRQFKASKDIQALLFTLNEGIHGNMGGMGNPKLYNHALFGTKDVISEYVETIADSLIFIAHSQNDVITIEEKLDFFHRAGQCFGRSALMLSGGGQLGNFHLGVLKTLVENTDWDNGLGFYYRAMGRYYDFSNTDGDKALEYYQRAIDAYKPAGGDYKELAFTYVLKGFFLSNSGLHDKTFPVFEEGIKYARQTKYKKNLRVGE